jgi:homospermidine synthase
MEKRVSHALGLGKCVNFNDKKLLLIGHGCIGSTFLTLLLRHGDILKSNIFVIDEKKEALSKVPEGISKFHIKITKKNYKKEILNKIGKGDILVDLAYYISTCHLIELCNDQEILFINTAVEYWKDEINLVGQDPRTETLYERQTKMTEVFRKLNKKTTAIITHGANPGWVSHFVKEALIEMAIYMAKKGKLNVTKIQKYKEWIENDDFPSLAKDLDVQVIHISEKDSQIASTPKPPNVFRNTWSPVGFVEEGTAPAELGWGSHESKDIGLHYTSGPKNQIALRSRGINTWVKTWVPSGPLVGMVVRHEEAYSISKYLMKDNYLPTVHYAYLPCPDANVSLLEIQNRVMLNNKIPDFKEEIMNLQITEGKDELGVLLFSKDLTWWRGSLLDIKEARMLMPEQSATSVQVGISVLAAVDYMIRHPEEGVMHPEGMNHREVMWLIESYLGPVKSMKVDWSPLDSAIPYKSLNEKNPFCFENFVVSYQ